MMIAPIETSYKGYRFRSRLEARWAVFFECRGIKWVYEPEGYKLPDGSCYLPDFYLPGIQCYVEIKPFECESNKSKPRQLAASHCKNVILIEGQPWVDEHKATLWLEDGQSLTDCQWVSCLICGETLLSNWGQQAYFYPDCRCHGVIESSLEEAFKHARRARFEHGETPCN